MENDLAFARSKMYKLLSMAFGYPGDEFQAGLVDNSFFSQLEDVAKGLRNYGLASAVKCSKESADKYGSHIFSDIVSEYSAIFGEGQGAKCSPYELSYLAGPLFMSTGELADIAGFYMAFGLEAAEENRDRPDHLSTELEFMHVLALKEAFASRNGKRRELKTCRDAQRKFLGDHLGRWTGVFSRRLKTNGKSNFYFELSRLLDKFVSGELRTLGVKVEKIKRDKFDDAQGEEFSCGAVDTTVNQDGGEAIE